MNLEVARLVAEIQSGASEQVLVLWERFRPLWTKWSRRSGICGYEPEDLVQQSYMLLVEGLEKFRPERGVPFEGYYQYLLRGWAYCERRRKQNQPMGDVSDLAYVLADEQVNVQQDVVARLDWEAVLGALDELTWTEQQIVVGFYIEGCTLGVLSERLGLSYKGIEKKKAVTLKKLRKKLEAP